MAFSRISLIRTSLVALLVALVAPPAPVVHAQNQGEAGFQGYLQLVAARARAEGIGEAAINQVLNGLTLNPRVIELDRSQPGNSPKPPPFAPYRRDHVDASRIAGGQRMLAQTAATLRTIESRYGVPGPVILAIWGHETNYGRYTGDFDLPRSLATLAYEGRRRDLFASELVALMRMVDQGVPRYRLKGSWAGAFGNPQFLPSVYLNTAVDADGDGMRDIWNSPADTMASIANYFRDAGWRRGEPWGVAASVPAGFDWAAVSPKLAAPTCSAVHARHSAWHSVAEWRRMGVTSLSGLADTTQAALFQPDGPGTPAWLLTGNYRVILQYNCSNYYALSVGLLADEIAR